METEIIIIFFIISMILCFIIYIRLTPKEEPAVVTTLLTPQPLVKFINPFYIQIQQINKELLVILTNLIKCYLGIYWNVNINKFLEIIHKPWNEISTFKSLDQLIKETSSNSQYIQINNFNKNKKFYFDIPRIKDSYNSFKNLDIYPAVILTMLTDENINTENICLLITMVHISSDHIPLKTTIISQIVRRPNFLPFYLKKMYIPHDPINIDEDSNCSGISNDNNLYNSINENSTNFEINELNEISYNCRINTKTSFETNIISSKTNFSTNCTINDQTYENKVFNSQKLINKSEIKFENPNSIKTGILSTKLENSYKNTGLISTNESSNSVSKNDQINKELSELNNQKLNTFRNDKEDKINFQTNPCSSLRNRRIMKATDIDFKYDINIDNIDYSDIKVSEYKVYPENLTNTKSNKEIFKEAKNNFDKISENKYENTDLILKSCLSDKLIESPLCSVCISNKVTCISMPCKHVCVCNVCHTKLLNCPLCRCQISYTIPIIFS